MTRTRSGILLTASLCLAACGGMEAGGVLYRFPETPDSLNLDAGAALGGSELLLSIDQLDAQSPRLVEIPDSPAAAGAPDALLNEIERLVAAAGGPQRAPLPALHFTECHPVITGFDGDALIDSDADGIPDDYKVDYGTACVSEGDSVAPVRVTISGYRRIEDSGIGFRSFRVRVAQLVLLVEYLNTGVRHRTVLDGVEEGSFAAGGALYGTGVVINESISTPGERDRAWFREVDFDLTFTPAAGQALTFAAPLPAGSVTLHGSMQHVDPEIPDRLYYNFLLLTPTSLQWSPSCNGGDFIGGALLGRYNGKVDVGFQYTWQGCSSLEKELFGYAE